MTETTVALATVQETIARAIAKYPLEQPRIMRAALLIALGHVARIDADTYTVRSQTTEGVVYTLTAGTVTERASGCTCKDAQRYPGKSCKHGLAVDILQVAEERQRRQDLRQRFSALSADELGRLAAFKARYQAQPAMGV
jgi:phenylalanyl-tRNA synthetase alpha subunit